MGSSQRLAAVAAVSHARHYYNNTRPEVVQTEGSHYTVNIFFVSATLCGVLVAVCAACWRRAPGPDKPEDAIDTDGRGVYTVSADPTLMQVPADLPGPPPAYETVVDVDVPGDNENKPCSFGTQICTPETCPHRPQPGRADGGLPSYETAVLLKDTKL